MRTALALLLMLAGACGTAEPVARAPAPTATREAAPVDAGVGADASRRRHPGEDFATKHMVYEEDEDGGVAPADHHEMLWGDYIDKRGKPAVGWHSHHPATGNAR